VEEISYFGYVEDQNAFDKDHVCRVDGRQLLTTARVLPVVIDGHFAALAVQNVNQSLMQQLIVEGVLKNNRIFNNFFKMLSCRKKGLS